MATTRMTAKGPALESELSRLQARAQGISAQARVQSRVPADFGWQSQCRLSSRTLMICRSH